MKPQIPFVPACNITLLAEAPSIVAKAVAKGWARRPGYTAPVGKIVKFEPKPKEGPRL